MATREPQAADKTGLFTKMVKVMASMERVPKRGHNDHFHYDFVTEGDVLDAVRKALVAEGIALFVSFNEMERRDNKIAVGKLTLTFCDAETGQTYEVQWIGEGQDTQDKGAAKAATSAVKYALLKTFLISTGDAADDPDTSTSEAKAPRKRTAPTKAATSGGPPEDLWEQEDQWEDGGAPAMPYLDVGEIGVFDTKKGGKPHLGLMADGHKWPDIRWWDGRTALLETAPWLGESATEEQLGEMDARFPFAARVYYTEDAQGYKSAVRFEQLA